LAQIVKFDKWKDLTLSFGEDYLRNLTDHIILDPKDPYETNYIGGGLPPIETPCGWLLIYHGVNETATGKVYHAKAVLFPLKNLKWNYQDCLLFSPTKKWEKEGVVNNVVFPTGRLV
jgi:predicted GH43/DUF377 family glycosyl hydrolase